MRTAAPFPRPPEGGGGQGVGGRTCRKRQGEGVAPARGGGGQVRPPRPGGAPPDSATTSTAERAPSRGEARARAGTRPAAGGTHASPPTSTRATATRAARAASKPPRRILAGAICEHGAGPQGHARPHTEEAPSKRSGAGAAVPGAPCWRRVLAACMGRAPVRPRIVKHRAAKRKARAIKAPTVACFLPTDSRRIPGPCTGPPRIPRRPGRPPQAASCRIPGAWSRVLLHGTASRVLSSFAGSSFPPAPC